MKTTGVTAVDPSGSVCGVSVSLGCSSVVSHGVGELFHVSIDSVGACIVVASSLGFFLRWANSQNRHPTNRKISMAMRMVIRWERVIS